MILKRFKYCLFILAYFAQFFYETQSKNDGNFVYGVRFKSTTCEADNKTILTNYCYLKAVSRKIVTFNLGLKFLVPYKKPFFGHIILYYRYGTIFRQIIDTKVFEVCVNVDGSDTNPFVKLVIDFIKNQAPNTIHKCPYKDDWELKNFTLNMDLIDKASKIFPQGIYRWDFSAYLNDIKTLNVSIIFEAKSPIKESFG